MNYIKMMNLYFGFYNYMRKRAIKRSDRFNCINRLDSSAIQLTQEQKKKIEDFWAPYEKITTIFHQMYYEKTGLFSEKYIPIDVYTNVIDEYFNPRTEGKYIDNKCYYNAFFGKLRQPEFAVMRNGGFWYNDELQMISEDEVKEIVSKEKELFVKVATESYGGKGVKYVSAENNIVEEFLDFVKGTDCDIIAQRAIKQHKDIAAVNESSVNTVRMISLLTKEGPKIYSSIFRVGMKGKKVDNYTSGGLTVGIKQDGTLNKYAFNDRGERFDKHPSNDFVFEGYEIPGYQKARELVMKAHPMIPHFKLVSFDVAIDENGEPIFIEANLCKGSIEIHEFNNGPLFGDDTKKILDEVYGINKA